MAEEYQQRPDSEGRICKEFSIRSLSDLCGAHESPEEHARRVGIPLPNREYSEKKNG